MKKPFASNQILGLLTELTGIEDLIDESLTKQLDGVVNACDLKEPLVVEDIKVNFYALINEKIQLNKPQIREIHRVCAKHKVLLNYHQKKYISELVNSNDKDLLIHYLIQSGLPSATAEELVTELRFTSNLQTKNAILKEASSPTKIRKKTGRWVSRDVQLSALGSLIWCVFDKSSLRKYFCDSNAYSGDYQDLLDLMHHSNPELFNRDRSLVIRLLRPHENSLDYESYRSNLESWIAYEYFAMNNYGHLAIIFEVENESAHISWRLVSELILFAERFHSKKIETGFFHPEKIAKETLANNKCINSATARFDHAPTGFTYRDQFVLYDAKNSVKKILLILQKNTADETKINCPACFSSDVRGNSYPTLGVKSWECMNAFCPEKSIYNRGKRYSFKSLIAQSAIEDLDSQIPMESIRHWRRDVLQNVTNESILKMLILHYSKSRDAVKLIGDLPSIVEENRIVSLEEAKLQEHEDFWNSEYFSRYIPLNPQIRSNSQKKIQLTERRFVEINGDAQDVLLDIEEHFFDRAITSPPYFNAKSYSQWPNLYCYLYDMAKIHQELFRTLKIDSLYFFNIFDYFDNENTIALSAMGTKRIALSAHFVDLFQRLGMNLIGNIVWDKGEIEGSRAFNSGNQSPFYQSPFNCWEHILVFQKSANNLRTFNEVVRINPVFKISKGINVLGHSAPFPEEIPALGLNDLAKNSVVVDPFGGTGTTARAAMKRDIHCVLIEKSLEYHELSKRLNLEYKVKY